MRVLLTGGSGLLASHMTIEADRPSHQELDITKPIKPGQYDLIIHAAAYTGVAEAETERRACYDTNVTGTFNMLEAYPNTPFVFISSEYAHKPVNFYSVTKSLGEQMVMTHPHHLIIRTLFKPRPFPFEYAFRDQVTQGDYVDVIAELIEATIADWDRTSKLMYIGTGRKTMLELALQTRLDVKENSVKDIKSVKIPADYL